MREICRDQFEAIECLSFKIAAGKEPSYFGILFFDHVLKSSTTITSFSWDQHEEGLEALFAHG